MAVRRSRRATTRKRPNKTASPKRAPSSWWKQLNSHARNGDPDLVQVPGFMEEWRREYEAGDLQVLYDALQQLSLHGELRVYLEEAKPRPLRTHVSVAVPPWLIVALARCVGECQKHALVNRTTNQFDRQRARNEDMTRYVLVSDLKKRGLKPVQAYKEAARLRYQTTGTSVSWRAVFQSCRRVNALREKQRLKLAGEPWLTSRQKRELTRV